MAADPGRVGSSERLPSEGTGSTGQTAAGGDQGQRRRPGGRRGSQQRDQQAQRASKFEGRCDDLKGHIYDYANPRQAADQYTKTTREICEYVGRTYKYGADTKSALENLAVPTLAPPADHADKANRAEIRLWEKRIDEFVKKEIAIEENLKTAFSLVYGQCTDELRAKLESRPNHAAIEAASDSIGLLKNIRTVMFQFQSQRYGPLALHEAKRRFYLYTQDKNTSCQQYYETFRNNVEVIEYCGGAMGTDPTIVDNELLLMGSMREIADDDQVEAATAAARDRVLACAFLFGSDKVRYGKLLEDLENGFTQGNDVYPATLQQAYTLLVHWKQDPRNVVRLIGGVHDGVAFANVGSDGSERTQGGGSGGRGGGRRLPTCYRCNEQGHLARDCPAERAASSGREEGNGDLTATQLLMQGVEELAVEESFQFAQIDGRLPDSWILLDNQSTVNIFRNKDLLQDVRATTRCMRVRCNAGWSVTNLMGRLPGYPGEVWYNPDGIANILSLADAEKYFRIRYDSGKESAFVVEKPDGTERKFLKTASGLFCYDTAAVECSGGLLPSPGSATTLITTVDDKKSKYTARAYGQALLARKIQKMVGYPSTRDFLRLIDGNLIPNCPVNRADVVAAEDIMGPSVDSLKGKTVRRGEEHVSSDILPVPRDILSLYRAVTLCVDIMYVNKLPFLVTISRHIKFATIELLSNRQEGTIGKSITGVMQLYGSRGFLVTMAHADGEFEGIRGQLASNGSGLNICSADEHVPEVERFIRTVKERARCMYHSVPFLRLPALMIKELVTACVFWLNMFPPHDGVSPTLSPRALMAGFTLDYNRHCRLEFGEYVQTHEEHDNSMQSRTTGAIALRPTGNRQGGYYFMSLTTGRRLTRNRWTCLPMPQDVIDRVNTLGRRSFAADDLTFAWRDGTPILDDNDDSGDDADSDYDPAEDQLDDDASAAGVDDESDDDLFYDSLDDMPADADPADDDNNDSFDDMPADADPADDDNMADADPANDGDMADADPANYDHDVPAAADDDIPADVDPADDDTPADVNPADDDETPGVHGQIPGVGGQIPGVDGHIPGVANDTEIDDDETAEDGGLDAHMDAVYGPRTHDHGLRPRKPRDYSHLHAELEHTAFTQYNVKKGLKIFGEAGAEAVIKEMQQLHDREVIQPRSASMLTREEKRDSLQYLMFLKKKRCGRIKGRGCADGRKQRIYKTKEETSAPTVSVESLFLSCVIDAKEGRKVVTCDIPGAFMQADIDEVIHVRLEGPLAMLLTKVDPDLYTKFLSKEGGKDVMYVRLAKALYGTLQAAMLFWKDLSGYLVSDGFELNPYDNCVANKMINGKQCTVLWHVDDLKMSHVQDDVLETLVDQLNDRYGKIAPLTVTRGTTHDYLGMTLDYGVPGQVTIRMDDYVEDILSEVPEDMGGVAATPAAEHLFDVSENPTYLDDENAQLFHHLTAKLLFLCKRARPDIQTAIAFLTTRVKRPDTDDYKKLGRVIKYLRGTPNLALTLEADDAQIVKWWADASFAVHTDMRSHTGGTASLGKGSVYSASTRQKLNTKSSTEAELVAVDDVMPLVLWTRYFLDAQGYGVKENIVYQDNQSAILLEKNGRRSSSRRTRHINIRYFFVTDRISAKELTVEYCPTGEMLADMFTKPLQGSSFRRFRDAVMNIKS
jgi:Reverse transcriptase (RNA-dependent DNA polymerase)/Zinc knuckle